MSSIRANLKPQTTMGKWSTGLIIAFFLFVAVFVILVALGQRGGDKFFSNLALAIPGLLAGVSAVSAFLTGIVGIIRSKERSIIVFLATTIGFFLLILIIGEIVFPH